MKYVETYKEFIKWFMRLLMLAGAIVGFFIWKRSKATPINKTVEAKKIAPNNDRLIKLTQDLAHHLGYAYAWFDWRSWTENDKEVFALLENLSKNDVDIVANLYTKVYAKGNDLRVDLAKVLDSKLYEQLRNL